MLFFDIEIVRMELLFIVCWFFEVLGWIGFELGVISFVVVIVVKWLFMGLVIEVGMFMVVRGMFFVGFFVVMFVLLVELIRLLILFEIIIGVLVYCVNGIV